MSGASRFSRAPRKPVPIMKSERFDTLRRVQADPRFRAMKASTRYCLVVAVTCSMDGEGKWWLKVREWAQLAGYSPATVKRAILELERARVIRSVPYLRPDGRQGSTTYWLARELVARLPDLSVNMSSHEPPWPEPPPLDQEVSLALASLGEGFSSIQVAQPWSTLSSPKTICDGQGGSPLIHLVAEARDEDA